MAPRPYLLEEANYRQLLDDRPLVAILPWGATEAHNFHLPHGTDVIEGAEIARGAAAHAHAGGAKVIVLPPVPFGNNEQQLDQVATVSITTATAAALLNDVVRSLKTQGIDRMVILNAHGGNAFEPLVRDLQSRYGFLIVVVNFWQVRPDLVSEIFDDPGDHAGEMETSLMLYLRPKAVVMAQAGKGKRVPFEIEGIDRPGTWTARPWSRSHPDTGAGDPANATAEKGNRYFQMLSDEVGNLLVNLSKARKGDLPYV